MNMKEIEKQDRRDKAVKFATTIVLAILFVVVGCVAVLSHFGLI